MFAVRYVALAALAVWVGSMVGEWMIPVRLLGYVCGALVFVSLFVMKFMGPPPHAFIPRVAIVTVMLAVAVWPRVALVPDPRLPLAIDTALGLALLFWYVRE